MDETNVQKQISTGSESNSEESIRNESKYMLDTFIILKQASPTTDNAI